MLYELVAQAFPHAKPVQLHGKLAIGQAGYRTRSKFIAVLSLQ